MNRCLITGSGGFVGSALVDRCVHMGIHVRALVRNPSQRSMQRLGAVLNSNDFDLVFGDFSEDINGLCEGIDTVFHLGALTYVDRSIVSPEPFVKSNVLGTLHMLEDARKYKVNKFICASTDEVHGAILNGSYDETSMVNPSNPYSASKVGAEALAMAYAKTYGLNTLVTRSENVYGPWQHPQKVIPTFVRHLQSEMKVPIYGNGQHVRQWIHIEDHVDALIHLMLLDTAPGSIYNIAGARELTNIELADMVIRAYGHQDVDSWKQFVDDSTIRPGHDRRYALDTSKINNSGWMPHIMLESGIPDTVRFYVNHPSWTL